MRISGDSITLVEGVDKILWGVTLTIFHTAANLGEGSFGGAAILDHGTILLLVDNQTVHIMARSVPWNAQ